MKRYSNKLIPKKVQEEKISKHEDIALKVSAEFFKDEIMPILDIKGKVIGSLATESISLDLRKGYQDFRFLMEDESIKHFEFQSTNEGLIGLKRFRMYEAVISYENKKEVTTYVMFSGNIKKMLFYDGVAEGEVRGRAEGERALLILQIQRKLEKGKSLKVIADEVEMDLETIAVLIEEIDKIKGK